MSGLVVDAGRCIGCGRCVRACGSAGIALTGERRARVAVPTDSCVLCGACVDACPVDAIAVERGAAADVAELDAYRGYWVFCQVDEAGEVLPVAFELLGRARDLADARGCMLTALIAKRPEASGDAAAPLIAAGADEVICCRDSRLDPADTEALAHWICGLVRERRPEAVLYGATALGRALAPAVAVRLKTGLTADCTVLSIDPETGFLEQTRPAFGGNLMATIICPAHRPQMATVRPGVFSAPVPDAARTGGVVEVGPGEPPRPRVRVLGRERASAADSITDAEVLVVVGRGIGSKKNLPLMERLASLLGGKLGCTRPLVEAGWLESWHQVGQTGVSVAPRLLVSVGVSGAIQHLAGTSGAETVVAINEDAAAPIFGAATYRVEGDCIKIVRALVERLEERGCARA